MLSASPVIRYAQQRRAMLTTYSLLGKVLNIHVCVCGQLLQHWLNFCLKGTLGQRWMMRIRKHCLMRILSK